MTTAVRSSDEPITEAPSRRPSVASSTAIVLGASAFSSILGFVREIITAHYFGTKPELDAFLNASTIPTVLFGVFNGALVSSLVPTFSTYMSQGRPDDVRKLGNTVINGLFIIMTVLGAIAWLLAPFFVPAIAHGFPLWEQALEVRLVRWLLPGIIAMSVGGVFSALLNVNHRFTSTAMVWVAANTVTICTVWALHVKLGIFALALGTVLGLFTQLLIQAPSLIRYRLYRAEFDFRHPGLASVVAALIPVSVATGAWQINLAFDRYFASTLDTGTTSALNYTTKVSLMPSIVAVALATVTFPLIATQFASSNLVAVRNSLSLALRMLNFVLIPSAAILTVLAFPIVQALFQRGAFGESATTLCAALMPFACLPLIATSYGAVLVRACYACKETRLTVAGAAVCVVINVLLSSRLVGPLGGRGLLLANGISEVLIVSYQLMLLQRLVGGLAWNTLLRSFVKVSISSLAMALVLFLTRSFAFAKGVGAITRDGYLLFEFSCAAGVFFVAARLLRVQELSMVTDAISKKLKRRAPSGAASQSA